MKPLDFIITEKGNVGIITDMNGNKALIEFLGRYTGEKTAWWSKEELTIIDNLPHLLFRSMSSKNYSHYKQLKDAEKYFPSPIKDKYDRDNEVT